MEVSGDCPQFWPPPSDPQCRRSQSSPLLFAPILIILLPIIGLLVIFLVVPMLLSAAQHIFRPNSIKKSWDSVNILLVSFAILCGVFARRQDDRSVPPGGGDAPVAANDSLNGTVKFEAPSSYGDGATASGVGRLKRNSSSYPDLRQNLLWETGDNRFRFFDDFEINRFRSSATASHFKFHARGSEFEKTDEVKEIPVDTFVLRTPPPPPPPLVVGLKPRRTNYENIAQREKVENVICQNVALATPPAPPLPPPPSPSMRVKLQLEIRSGKLERRKSNAAEEIKMLLASIYNPQRKRKRKQRTQNQGEISTELGWPFSYGQPPSPPPPPPPPPPPSMFHNLFKKGNKSRKVHSAHAPPPPTIPPSPAISSSKRSSKQKPTQSNMCRPPLRTTSSSIVWNENAGNNGGESPLPPPPPPPFKILKTKKGGLVRAGSPEVEEIELVSSWSSGKVGGVFCPSPDINMKADTFIARLRDGWRVEKMNSLREKTKQGSEFSFS